MKWGIVGVLIVGLGLSVFLYVQPLMTLRSLSSAMEEGDVEGIRDHIDFDSVRQTLKDEFLAKMNLASGGDDNIGAGALVAALASKGVEGMLDGILSPEKLAQGGAGQVELTSSEYKTTSRFHATMQRGDSGPLTLVLRRSGMDWRVTAIKPPEMVWREFEGYRRQLTAEVGANLKAIFVKLSERHDRLKPGESKAISLPRTPAEPPCGEPYTWTEDDIAKWSEIGFAPSGPVNYSYEVLTGPDAGFDDGVTLLVAQGVSDLDCNGASSFFSLAMGENREGQLYRAPGIYAENELE